MRGWNNLVRPSVPFEPPPPFSFFEDVGRAPPLLVCAEQSSTLNPFFRTAARLFPPSEFVPLLYRRSFPLRSGFCPASHRKIIRSPSSEVRPRFWP